MAENATNYICPACLGPLHFSSATGKLECDYCGSSYTVEEMDKVNQEAMASRSATKEEKEEFLTYNGTGWGSDADKLQVYTCPSCNGQVICDATTAATSCPYCGNPTIVPGQFHGTLAPDYVIPFRYSKKDAENALRNHYKNKFLLPNVFKNDAHIREIKGIYVPFWLFDGEVKGSMEFTGTKVSTHRSGNYRVVTTSYYDVCRKGALDFEMVPVDASKKMPDDMMDSLEPYNYQELTDFTTAYLAGYFADKYDVDDKEAAIRARARCIRTTRARLQSTVSGYTGLSEKHSDLKVHQTRVNYVLLPVWLLTTKWKDQTYLYAMNGQTGKFVGNLPIDKRKLSLITWATFLGVFLPLVLFASPVLGTLIVSIFELFFG